MRNGAFDQLRAANPFPEDLPSLPIEALERRRYATLVPASRLEGDLRRARRFVIPMLGAFSVSGIAAALVAVLTLGVGAAPAVAHWTAVPTQPASGQTEAALRKCEGITAIPGKPVVVDTRGPYTAAMWATAQGEVSCFANGIGDGFVTGPQPQSTHLVAGAIETSTGNVAYCSSKCTRTKRGVQQYTYLDGRIGSGVTNVAVHLSDGITVQATVEHHWYLLWWPGKSVGVSATVTTGPGKTTTVHVPSAHVPGLEPCAQQVLQGGGTCG